MALCQVSDHLASGHFAKSRLFPNPAVLFFAKNTGDKPNPSGKVRNNTAAVLFACEIENHVGIFGKRKGQGIAPESVQVAGASHRQFGLHFQPVRRHAVKGAEQAVKAGKNPQVFLDIIQLVISKHARRHILVLNAFIGENCRSEIGTQVGLPQPVGVLTCQGFAAFPKGAQLVLGHGLKSGQQKLGPVEKKGSP